MTVEYWVENDGVRIHYLRSSAELSITGETPVLFVPGALGIAELYQDEFVALAPRPCIAVSLRGRGQSDAPETGYSFEDQVSDVEAVVNALNCDQLCLVGFSMGVSFVLGYAMRHPHRVKGVVVIDYPARYPAISPQWVELVLESGDTRAKAHVVRALQRESREILLWEHLDKIGCPVLIMRGQKTGAVLDAEQAQHYLAHLPEAQLMVFEEAGHELWEPDFDNFMNRLKEFLVSVDVS